MTTDGTVGLDALAGVSVLDDPLRMRLYEYLSEQDDPVSRDDAAAAVGISRALAAYHLDKLAEAGLLAVAYQRPPDRRGPGAGRPAKVYRRSEAELAVSTPPRAYELLARLLVEAVERDAGGAVRALLHEAARAAGSGIGAESAGDAGLVGALRAGGYHPSGDEGAMELRNCPFHRLAQQHGELVCAMNLSLITGLLAGLGRSDLQAIPEPRSGRCCVVIRAADASS